MTDKFWQQTGGRQRMADNLFAAANGRQLIGHTTRASALMCVSKSWWAIERAFVACIPFLFSIIDQLLANWMC